MNHNQGVEKGCGAGRNGAVLDVNGRWIPCRHLMTPEEYPTPEAYWWHSHLLQHLRQHEDERDTACQACSFQAHCLLCRAAGHDYLCSLV
ncbi:hypothetical protein [Anoxynatronum sibiricum]|uniref:Uncharacterized protein n=1 Tax=Anoxynatronum sibiricum TaxID=210623 RepID=A0ABU9VX78_9CLOT